MRTAALALPALSPGPQQCPLTFQPLGVYLLCWVPVDIHLPYELLPCELLPKT